MILVMQHCLLLAQTTWQRMSSVQLLYTAQTSALRTNCEVKQKRNPEERNVENMTEFLEKIKNFHWLAHLTSTITDSFRVKDGVNLEREKKETRKR